MTRQSCAWRCRQKARERTYLPESNARYSTEIPVETSIADILEKHDPVMARAVALIDSAQTPL